MALPADGRAVLMNSRAVGPVDGQRVSVLAAAGGVGTLLVRLARGGGDRGGCCEWQRGRWWRSGVRRR
ncbi:hypothetical protein ACRAKI_26845 [Saccharothrix isguenensis]